MESKEKKEWQEYSRKEKLNKVLHFAGDDIDKNTISKIYLLKKLNEKQDNKVLDWITDSIKNQKYLWLSFKRNQEQYNFDYLDREDTVYAVDKSYEVYLLVDNQNKYYLTVITDHAFFPDGLNHEQVLFKEVEKFAHKLYFFNSLKLL